ncbi:hypothetical protein SOVF_134170 [Spinacia oleracea]|nr:hypothetical protein SOVF_134170 [Spinacia oleracea]
MCVPPLPSIPSWVFCSAELCWCCLLYMLQSGSIRRMGHTPN